MCCTRWIASSTRRTSSTSRLPLQLAHELVDLAVYVLDAASAEAEGGHNELWHLDVTIIGLLDDTRLFLHGLVPPGVEARRIQSDDAQVVERGTPGSTASSGHRPWASVVPGGDSSTRPSASAPSRDFSRSRSSLLSCARRGGHQQCTPSRQSECLRRRNRCGRAARSLRWGCCQG